MEGEENTDSAGQGPRSTAAVYLRRAINQVPGVLNRVAALDKMFQEEVHSRKSERCILE